MGAFPNNKYLTALVEPIRDGRRQPVEVQVYEFLEPAFDCSFDEGFLRHIRYMASFPLHKDGKALTLQQIAEEVKVLDRNRTGN